MCAPIARPRRWPPAAIRRCGVNGAGAGPVSPEWMIPKALWIARHQPEIFAAAVMVGEYQDYLNLRLTGRWCASLNNVTMRWHYQTDHGGWPDSMLDRLGLSALRAEMADRDRRAGPA